MMTKSISEECSIYKDNEEYKNIHEGDNTYSNKKSFSDKLFDNLSQELVDS